MTSRPIIRLVGPRQRDYAKQQIDMAPAGWLVRFSPPTRSNYQSAKMWAMIGDLMKQKPEGRDYPKEVWKALAMAMAGHKVRFEPSLDGSGVIPVGFSSRELTVSEMGDVIEALYAYGARHDVVWSEPDRWERAA